MNGIGDIVLLFIAIICFVIPATIIVGTCIIGTLVLIWDEVEAIIYGNA